MGEAVCKKDKIKYLNLGCGIRYLSNWTNVDFVKSADGVIAHNLTLGIPFSGNCFDVVYHSHVLEHFQKEHAEAFLKECYRVLKPNGIIRIAVPDLEQIARIYIEQLNKVISDPSPLNKANHEWSIIEMYDQTVRNYSGGEMGRYWSQPNLINETWIAKRTGDEFLSYRRLIDLSLTKNSLKESPVKWTRYFKLSTYRNYLMKFMLGEPRLFELLELARFRTGGEIHQWMYDRYSLGSLLETVGFSQIRVVDAITSSIPDWEKHQWLDVENGKVRKPDSLFMEAVK
jgi:predicted SAM-dependent methyltransferase